MAVSERLLIALEANGTDPAALPHAMRYFVSAWADDLPPAEMRGALVSAGLAPERIDRAVEQLEHDAALLEAAALSTLQAGFDDEGSRELADGALGAARSKLPVVEAGLIAIVAVYGMWLVATKGRRSHQRVIRRGADGSWEEIESTEWYGPSGPLEAIADVLSLDVDGSADESQDQLPGRDGPSLPPPADPA